DDLHLRKYVERLPWSVDLFKDRIQEDNPARTENVRGTVFRRVRADHGRFRHHPDSGADRVPLPAEVLRGGRCLNRFKGLIREKESKAIWQKSLIWIIPYGD